MPFSSVWKSGKLNCKLKFDLIDKYALEQREFLCILAGRMVIRIFPSGIEIPFEGSEIGFFDEEEKNDESFALISSSDKSDSSSLVGRSKYFA